MSFTHKNEPTTLEKMQGLKWAILFTGGNSAYVQLTFFGSLFVLFLDTLGFSKTEIGGLLALLPLTGLMALFIGPQMARFGYKRAFLTFFGARTLVSALLLLTPLLITWVTGRGVLYFIVIILLFFSVFRAIGLIGWMPWNTEFVPASVRGKYTGLNNISSNAAAFITVTIASLALGESPTISDFNLMFAIGIGFAVISLAFISRVPGGAPIASSGQTVANLRQILAVFNDRNMTMYLIGRNLVGLAIGPMVSFVPLFMAEKVGLNSGEIVFLQTGTLLGGMLFSYIWGWASDRYGSKPVMLWGTLLTATLPVFWFLMPKFSVFSLSFALGIALFKGIADTSWNIGAATTLYVNIVPIKKRASYMGLHYAMISIFSAISQLFSGYLLDATENINIAFWGIQIDSYFILFVLTVVLLLIAVVFLWRIQVRENVGVGQFATMFMRGNPLLAMSSMIGFHRARDEKRVIQQTERLGKAQSPLNVEELLSALADPRFNVRYEAVISIARHGQNEKLTQGLLDVLQGKDPALASLAAWALGRVADPAAIPALRAMLVTPYRSVKGYCIRALGSMNDQESRERFVQEFDQEEDTGLQLAYASALSKLSALESLPRMLEVLAEKNDMTLRNQFTMALAILLGDDNTVIELLRKYPDDPGTTISQGILVFGNTAYVETLGIKEGVLKIANLFARQNLQEGTRSLLLLIEDHFDNLPVEPSHQKIVRASLGKLSSGQEFRQEYLILLIFILSKE